MQLDRRWGIGVLVLSSLCFGAIKRDLAGGEVSFRATTNLFPFTGSSKGLDGFIEIDGKKFQGLAGLPLATLDTGMKLRDKHMLEDIGASKQPVASMRFKGHGEKFEGELTLNGFTRNVDGSTDGGLSTFKFLVRLSDFAIPRRAIPPIYVQDDVQVTVRITGN